MPRKDDIFYQALCGDDDRIYAVILNRVIATYLNKYNIKLDTSAVNTLNTLVTFSSDINDDDFMSMLSDLIVGGDFAELREQLKNIRDNNARINSLLLYNNFISKRHKEIVGFCNQMKIIITIAKQNSNRLPFIYYHYLPRLMRNIGELLRGIYWRKPKIDDDTLINIDAELIVMDLIVVALAVKFAPNSGLAKWLPSESFVHGLFNSRNIELTKNGCINFYNNSVQKIGDMVTVAILFQSVSKQLQASYEQLWKPEHGLIYWDFFIEHVNSAHENLPHSYILIEKANKSHHIENGKYVFSIADSVIGDFWLLQKNGQSRLLIPIAGKINKNVEYSLVFLAMQFRLLFGNGAISYRVFGGVGEKTAADLMKLFVKVLPFIDRLLAEQEIIFDFEAKKVRRIETVKAERLLRDILAPIINTIYSEVDVDTVVSGSALVSAQPNSLLAIKRRIDLMKRTMRQSNDAGEQSSTDDKMAKQDKNKLVVDDEEEAQSFSFILQRISDHERRLAIMEREQEILSSQVYDRSTDVVQREIVSVQNEVRQEIINQGIQPTRWQDFSDEDGIKMAVNELAIKKEKIEQYDLIMVQNELVELKISFQQLNARTEYTEYKLSDMHQDHNKLMDEYRSRQLLLITTGKNI